MPRENRKRGKKHKKVAEEDEKPVEQDPVVTQQPGQPSWIVPAPIASEEVNLEAPFGYVDADVKAYFRTVDVQIRDWQENEAEAGEVGEDLDPNEERRLFFVAALTEMAEKEKQLATDPDCSLILERMAYSMDDFVRRVLMDKLAGSYEALVKHRFASHVCQTLFTVAADTVPRECRGILPAMPDSSDQGELRTLTQLVVDVCEELLPTFTSLIMDPFASHVIRALLLLLSPSLSPSDISTQSTLRSKKSAAWKARQGPLKSVFTDDKGKMPESFFKNTPKEFRQIARKFIQVVRDELSENEVRALAANKVASPVLQLLLEVEADQDMAESPGSLMDRVMVGIITACRDDPTTTPEPSDYLNTLLRDPTSSHLLETLVTRSPNAAFGVLWLTYFKGKLPRLAGHPVANFVLAKALERVTANQLAEACSELEGAWGKIVKSSRTGVLRAAIDRAAVLHTHEKEIGEAILFAFDLTVDEDYNFLVPCALRLLPLQEYKSTLASKMTQDEKPKQHQHGRRDANDNPLEPKIQGAILLQSLLRLAEPHNQLVTDSITSLTIDERLQLAHHPMSSRVLDALLESPTVPFKAKRQFVVSLIGHFQLLVDDRIGSRVGDRCWAFADTYLKEKIARSLIPHESFLAGSYYGKFFARNLNLYLLQRRPDEWKTMQSERKRASQAQSTASSSKQAPPAGSSSEATESVSQKEKKKRKREARPDDEIDAVFNATLGKKIKKGALTHDTTTPVRATTAEKEAAPEQPNDLALRDVLGAIRAAPGDGGQTKRKRVR